MSLSPTVELSLTLQAQRDDDAPEKPVCARCRSTEITFDATAYWDARQQQFEYDVLGEKALCLNCDGKKPVDWIPA